MFLRITGVPGKVPIVSLGNKTNGSTVNFLLIWGVPDNNYDPIIMYHVSCSGDAPCPQSYNTSDNQTTHYTSFTGFNPNGYYTFSVVAINTIGSGEAGVVMVGEIPTTTIAPSVVSATISSDGMTSATIPSCKDITTTTTTATISSEVNFSLLFC